MAYNRINKLKLIVVIQNITLEHTSKGVTQEWVYKNIIEPTYFITQRTYYTYLSTPAKQELKRLEASKSPALQD